MRRRKEEKETSDPTLIEVRATDLYMMRDYLENESGM